MTLNTRKAVRYVLITTCVFSVWDATQAQVGTLRELTPLGDGTCDFGTSVSIDEGIAIVGDPCADTAYLFDVTTGEQLFILHGDNARFGQSVDIAGGVALVGAPSDSRNVERGGAAYAFDVATGEKLYVLSPPVGDSMDGFGVSVALDGNTALVASSIGEKDAFVFDSRNGVHLQTIHRPTFGYNFGNDLDVQGNIAIIGAPYNGDTKDGQVYLFDVVTGELLNTFAPPGNTTRPYFGGSVDIDGGLVAIGEYPAFKAYNGSGAVDVFDLETNELLVEVISDDPSSVDFFGSPVALSDGILAVGAVNDSSTAIGTAGALHLFNVGTGERLRKFPGEITNMGFGSAVSAQTGDVVVGAWGSAFVIPIPEPSTCLLSLTCLMTLWVYCSRNPLHRRS